MPLLFSKCFNFAVHREKKNRSCSGTLKEQRKNITFKFAYFSFHKCSKTATQRQAVW